jgi:hypothetical protein
MFSIQAIQLTVSWNDKYKNSGSPGANPRLSLNRCSQATRTQLWTVSETIIVHCWYCIYSCCRIAISAIWPEVRNLPSKAAARTAVADSVNAYSVARGHKHTWHVLWSHSRLKDLYLFKHLMHLSSARRGARLPNLETHRQRIIHRE